MQKIKRHIKRHYKKLASAIAGAACLSAAIMSGLPASLPAAPAPKPIETQKKAVSENKNETGFTLSESSIPTTTEPAKIPLANRQAPAEASQLSIPENKDNQAKEQPAPKIDPDKAIEVTATAYAPGPHDNDQYGTKTHIGTEVRPGVIAVDPRVIPLGARVMLKFPNGKTQIAVAEDTGGAIKGRRIDVAMWSVKEAYRFGIKPVKVYILETPSEKTRIKYEKGNPT